MQPAAPRVVAASAFGGAAGGDVPPEKPRADLLDGARTLDALDDPTAGASDDTLRSLPSPGLQALATSDASASFQRCAPVASLDGAGLTRGAADSTPLRTAGGKSVTLDGYVLSSEVAVVFELQLEISFPQGKSRWLPAAWGALVPLTDADGLLQGRLPIELGFGAASRDQQRHPRTRAGGSPGPRPVWRRRRWRPAK